MIRLAPIHYVSDVAVFTRFYETLRLVPDVASRTGHWAELTTGPATLALHSSEAADRSSIKGHVELCFEAEVPLEEISEQLRQGGYDPGTIIDEGFGRSLRLRDPMVILCRSTRTTATCIHRGASSTLRLGPSFVRPHSGGGAGKTLKASTLTACRAVPKRARIVLG
jgi:hypothetical protein